MANFDYGLDPRTFGLLSAGLGILGAAPGKSPFAAIGQGGLLGLQNYQQALDDQRMNKMREIQLKQAEQQAADQAAAREFMGKMSNPVSRFGQRTGSLAPTQQNADAFASQPAMNQQQLMSEMAMSGNPVLMAQAKAIREAMPKVKDYKQVMVNGQAFYQPMFEDGSVGPITSNPAAERLAFQNLGGQTVALNPFSGQRVAGFNNTLSPDAAASNALGWANNAVSQQRLTFDQQQAGKPQFHDGQWVMPPTSERPKGTAIPVPGYQKPLTEGQRKQLIGIDALNSAIGDYVSELDQWSKGRMLSPDSRARMGTKYNNMMLQAKEAYNLGVLNGPDLDILQSVVTDPRAAKSVLISNSALADQAETLRNLMGNTAAAVRSGGNPTGGATGSWGQPAGGVKFLGFE